jgi:nitrogenase-associated protein
LARVTFYEKPGCGTNARQKRMLEAAGHEIVTKNLLTESWTAERLRGFFGVMPVASWFNSAAPRVKSGEIDPMNVAAPAALALMLAEPLLIRRPLIEVETQRCAGFEDALVTLLLGGGNVNQDVLGCGRARISAPCPAPDDAGRRIQQ